MNQTSPSAKVTPAGDDEAVMLLEASLRELRALQAVQIYKSRPASLQTVHQLPLELVLDSHVKSVKEHCALYFASPPEQRGDATLNKRTYELMEATHRLGAELRMVVRDLKSSPG